MPEARVHHHPGAERVDAAVFGAVPWFARLSLDVQLAAPPRPGPARALLHRAAKRVATSPSPRPEAWRDAYQRLGLPPDLVPPHIALASWALGPGVPTQGPASDLVNAFSLLYQVPTACYEVDGLVGGLWLRPARGTESFAAMDGSSPAPRVGELILVDGAERVLARHWHGAQDRSSLPGSSTTRMRVHVDVLAQPGAAAQALAIAQRYGAILAPMVRGLLGASVEARVLHRGAPATLWP